MARYYVLYNPLAGNGNAGDVKTSLSGFLTGGETVFSDITTIDYPALFAEMQEGDKLVLAGGDGTINRFVNDTDGLSPRPSVYYYAAGNGNDFWNDLGKKKGDAPICIDKYLENLPTVTVNGMTKKFINGVGFGIDGYCCEVGDKLRSENKKVNYTSIAINGLLFHYKPKHATVTVDGEVYEFDKTWIAPTMFGRYYGGGMIPTPAQDRSSPDRKVSTCIMFGAGRIKTLTVFPSIFKGEHIKHVKTVKVLSGKTITVRFDAPAAVQIDGETVLNVTEYTVAAQASAANSEDAAA